MIWHWNNPPTPNNLLLAGPLHVWALTISPDIAIAALGVLAFALLALTAYALKSSN
jgi:hypothetical protein